MFSSNQILQVSGKLNQLEKALQFALDYSGHGKNIQEDEYRRGCRLTYQVTEDGKYCIGWAFLDEADKKLPEGWSEYPFRFDTEIVAKIIMQHLNDFPMDKDIWDGGYEKGFLMEVIPENLGDKLDTIKRPFYGIVSFKAYTCFYSK